MTRALQALRSRQGLRIVDQGAFSAGTFVITLFTARVESVAAFAQFSFTLAVSFVAVAAARSFGVTGVVIAGGRQGYVPSQSASWVRAGTAALTVGTFASALVFLVPADSAADRAAFSVLPIALCVLDAAKQTFVYRSLLAWSLFLSVTYGVGSSALSILGYIDGELSLARLWVGFVSVLAAFSLIAMLVVVRGASRFPYWHVSSRLAIEALLASAASQLGLFLLYFTHGSGDVSGYRLSYSIGYAAAFMLIQGMTPLMVANLAEAFAQKRSIARHVRRWWIFVAVALVTSGVLSIPLLLTFLGEDSLMSTLPFLVPVGLSILTAQWMESVFHGRRDELSPTVLLTWKTFMLVVEAGFVALGVLGFGVPGLVAGLVLSSFAKLALSIVWLRKID